MDSMQTREVGGRTPQACEACRRSKTKCSGTRPKCRRCLKRKTPCTWPGAPTFQDVPSSADIPGIPGTPESLPSIYGQSQATQSSPAVDAYARVGPSQAVALPQRLLDIFFERHHEVEFCAFLHKPTTTMAGLRKQAPVLATAIASLAALYLTADEAGHLTKTLGLPTACTVSLSDFYARQASVLGRHLTDQPSIPTIQAFLVLAVRELVAWKDFKAWMHAGTALRMADALQLSVELDADQQAPFVFGPTATSARRHVGPRQRETRRRTFWACFVVDRLISYTCHHRFYISLPPVISKGVATNVLYGTRGGGEDVRLPCANNTFAFDENDPGPWLNDFMGGQSPHQTPGGQLSLSRTSVTPFYLCLLRLWGDMALLHATGGRRRTPYAPTDPAGPFAKAGAAISDFATQVVPPAMHWSAANYRLHRLTGQAQMFVQFNFLLHHARCVMHHEYLPQLDMQYYSPLLETDGSNSSGFDVGLGLDFDYRSLMASDAAGLPPDYSHKPLIDTCIDAVNTITDMATLLYHGGDEGEVAPVGSGGVGGAGDVQTERDRGRAMLQSTVAANALVTAAAVHLWVVYTQTCDRCPKPAARAKFLLLLRIIQSWEPRWPVAAAWGETLGLLYKLYEYSYGTEPVPEFDSWEAEGADGTTAATKTSAAAGTVFSPNWKQGESSACRDHPGLSYGDILPDPAAVGQSLHDKVRSILVHPLHAPDVKRKNLRVFSQTLWQQNLWLLPGLLGNSASNDGLDMETMYM
ncbi:hypothetical protein HMPREF1624_01504 [Sporothrix schenckii ATCC 58251]|uniref:Zn(2)-C6 fungal-type domain-containing protein n=1 Tax=Sporothrix schenckii (strain ATCC 58251 / de Perez 2211183) TaxID=1391915 RepID=U7Q5N0_SPOS1|nr:hypothetical protein HMPREF1624_01504 [Sporothrix schenckii ATCC 58251]